MVKRALKFFFEAIPYRNFGISFVKYFKYKRNFNNGIYKAQLFGNNILHTTPFWYLHSLKEIFIDEVYRLGNSKNEELYIIDCGANIGLSIIYFKTKFPNAKVVAFEPDKEIFKLLQSNIASFQLKNVEIHNAAVWIEDKELYFNSEGSLGGQLITTDQIDTIKGNIQKTIGINLNNYLLETKVDFLKIDIEGAEFEVINACKENLNNVKFLFVEYHSKSFKSQVLPELLNIIQAAGFRFYIEDAWKTMKHPFEDFNKSFFYDLQLNIFCYRV